MPTGNPQKSGAARDLRTTEVFSSLSRGLALYERRLPEKIKQRTLKEERNIRQAKSSNLHLTVTTQ